MLQTATQRSFNLQSWTPSGCSEKSANILQNAIHGLHKAPTPPSPPYNRANERVVTPLWHTKKTTGACKVKRGEQARAAVAAAATKCGTDTAADVSTGAANVTPGPEAGTNATILGVTMTQKLNTTSCGRHHCTHPYRHVGFCIKYLSSMCAENDRRNCLMRMRVEHVGRACLAEIVAGYVCRKCLSNTFVGNVCRTHISKMLVEHVCRTRLSSVS